MKSSFLLVGIIWLGFGLFVVTHGFWHGVFLVIGVLMVLGGIF